MKKLLVIPDTQITAGSSLDRFDAVGNYIVKQRPDHIVHLGDLMEMKLLWRKTTKTRWSEADVQIAIEEITEEISHTNSALHKMFKGIEPLARRLKKSKKKPYKPTKSITLGNHDVRVDVFLEATQLDLDKDYTLNLGWFDNVCNYGESLSIEGISFTHAGAFGDNGPSSHLNRREYQESLVVGHSHLADCVLGRTISGRGMCQLMAGCFMDPKELDVIHSYGSATPNYKANIWNGVVILHALDGKGYFEPEFIGYDRFMKEYA